MKKKLWIVIGILALCYIIFVITRFSNYTTYLPFSRKLFCLESSDVKLIQITSGSGESVQIKETEEIKDIVNLLNDMRYQYCCPILEIAKGGYPYIIRIETSDENIVCEFDSDWIVYRNVRYYYDAKEGFETVIEMLEKQ